MSEHKSSKRLDVVSVELAGVEAGIAFKDGLSQGESGV